MELIEVPASASLLFKVHKSQLAKAQRALRLALKKPTSTTPNADSSENLNFDITIVQNNKSTERRHAREWVRVRELTEQDLVNTVHYRELVRHKVYLLLRKKPYVTNYWRMKIKLDWDEKLFRAVFRPLGQPARPTIVPTPKDLAPTLDGAWASKKVRMLQILARPDKALQQFLALEDFQTSELVLLSGYAFKHIDVRFVLELAAVFSCRSARLPGNRMGVNVFVTISKIIDDFTVHHALPIPSKTEVEPVLWNKTIEDEVKMCCTAMKKWHTPGNAIKN